MKISKYIIQFALLSFLSFCTKEEIEPANKYIGEDCLIKSVSDDWSTRNFYYAGNLIVQVQVESYLPGNADLTYFINYYENMIEIKKSADYYDLAYLENGILIKRFQGRIYEYDSDSSYTFWSDEEEFFYDDDGQLIRIVEKHTNNSTSDSWEDVYDFYWSNGNIIRIRWEDKYFECTYDNMANPLQGNITLVMTSDWPVPYAYFNSNNLIESVDWYGWRQSYTYDFNNSVYPTSVTHTDSNSITITRIGYLCD